MSNITVKGDGRILLNGVQHGPKYNYETACSQARLLAKTALAAGAAIEYETRIPTKADIEAETLANRLAAKAQKKLDSEAKKLAKKQEAKKLSESNKLAKKQAREAAKEEARIAAQPVLPPPPVNLPDTCPIAC